MSLAGRVMAAVDAFRSYGSVDALDATQFRARYELLGAFYRGTWTAQFGTGFVPADVGVTARQVLNRSVQIVDCYQHLVYQGELPIWGRDLPDEELVAIPIIPQTSNTQSDEALLRAFYTGFEMGRWQTVCSLVPQTAAIYGDCLVLLVDDYRRGVVMPVVYNPWKVPRNGLELDDGGNIKAVAIEYRVTVPASMAFGRDVKSEAYLYRKEITGTELRYYKDDRPFDYDGKGAIQPNPYGFVPGAWFRHQRTAESDRGTGAYEKALLPALEINSLLSAAIDGERRHLDAPIGIVGSTIRAGKTYTLPGGLAVTSMSGAADYGAEVRSEKQAYRFLPLTETGKFVSLDYDIGQTRELLTMIDENLIGQNPESEYAKLIAEITQPTAPGVRMALAAIIAKVKAAQQNHDPRMLALAQMMVSILGFRVNSGDIPDELLRTRTDRYDAFRPYDLTTWGKGLQDASIAPRNPFPESKIEKAQWVTLVDGMSAWGMREMGVSDEDIAQIEQKRQANQAAFDANLTGIADAAAAQESPA